MRTLAAAPAAGGVRGARVAAEHGARVVAAAFSPDGTALATAAADGYVMFFQVQYTLMTNFIFKNLWPFYTYALLASYKKTALK